MSSSLKATSPGRRAPSLRLTVVLGLALFGLFSLGSLSVAHGADYKVKLRFEPFQEVGEPLGTSVRLGFLDERPPSRGGEEDPLRFGTVRGALGEPWKAVNTGEPADQVVKKYAKELMVASGLSLTKEESAPLVRIVLTDLWLDGFVGYSFELGIRFEVERPNHGVVFSQLVHVSITGDGMNIPRMMDRLLADHAKAAKRAFAEHGFYSSLKFDSPPPTVESKPPVAQEKAPGPAPAVPGCSKDTDCKGDRICSNRECVNP